MNLEVVLDKNLVDAKVLKELVALLDQVGLDGLVLVVENFADIVDLDHQDLDVHLVPRNGLQNWGNVENFVNKLFEQLGGRVSFLLLTQQHQVQCQASMLGLFDGAT